MVGIVLQTLAAAGHYQFPEGHRDRIRMVVLLVRAVRRHGQHVHSDRVVDAAAQTIHPPAGSGMSAVGRLQRAAEASASLTAGILVGLVGQRPAVGTTTAFHSS